MKKELRRAVVMGLSAGLVLTSLAGCSKKDKTDWSAAAITVNDDAIPAGVLNFAVRYDQAMLESAYESFGISDPFNQDLYGSGQTMGEMAKEQEAEGLTHALLAEQKMDEYGVSVTDEDKAAITAAAAAFVEANDAEVLENMGVTQEHVERFLELQMVRHRMEEVMPADIDTEVSDEEAAQRRVQYVFFAPVTEEEEETELETGAEAEITPAETEAGTEAENTAAETESLDAEPESANEEASLVAEDHVMTTAAETETEAETTAAEAATEEETETETEDPETAEAKAKALVQAEEFLAKVMAGEDFDTAADELGKTANETTFGTDYYVEELVTATDGLEDGTLVETPVETDTGYYVVKLISQLDREATDAEKENIIEQRKADRIEELYTEWEEAGEVTQDAEVIAQIIFDYSLTPYVEPETEADTDVTPAETEAETEATPVETEAETEAVETEEAETAPAGTEAQTESVVSETETEAGTEA